MKKILSLIISLMIILFCSPLSAQPVTLELKNTNLSDAIRILAKFLHVNVVLSESIKGVVTLHLHDVEPDSAFQLLLSGQGLASWKMGNIWFVAPQIELIKRKQEALKWQTVWNDSLPLVTMIWRIKFSKAEEIAKVLQDGKVAFLSKRGRLRIDERTNMICIQDLAENIKVIHALIRRLDVSVPQIMIEARLVSVDSDVEQELGFRFPENVNVAKLNDSSNLDVKLSALEKEGRAELISSPRLFTSNRQSASIETGEEIPYQEVSDSGGTAVVFKKAVLGLKVTPQVLPGNRILLHLQINQDRPSNHMVLGMPTIRTRQMVTNVLVRNGHTIVLGGIYETNREEGEYRVPFISQIPLIGLLFTQKNRQENKRELLIFVTPKVHGNNEDSTE